MPEARRVQFRGMDLARPINRLRAGWVAFAQNVRALLRGGFGLRAPLTTAIYTLSAAVRTIERLNDTTPAGPVSGFAFVSVDAAGNLYCNGVKIAVGLSGNPVSMIPFRPNTSVQPWMYIGDSTADGNVTITTKFARDGTPTTFVCSGMLKVRSDGLVYKDGIKEPQTAPTVSTAGTTTTGTDALPATTFPWTNAGGLNSAYNYGQRSSGTDGTTPVIISTPVGAQTLTLVITGTATVNGVVHAPGDAGPTGGTYPANFTGAGPTIVLGAFTDGSGNVLTGSSPVPLLANVGAGITLQVPAAARAFQVGVDSSANTYSANSGSFSIAWTLVTSAIATKVSTLGNVTAYFWGDSPHAGPVAEYIWRNPADSGGGTDRTASTAAGSVTNNSWIFDSTPEDGTVAMQWSTLDSSGATVGSIPVFSPALETQGFQDFNMCVVGNLFIPAAGTYAFTFKNKDQIMVGIGGGVTTSSSATTGSFGQTKTVVNFLPLVYVSTPNGSGGAVTATVNITFPASGSYQVEIDYDYWFHSGRSLIMTCDSAVIPPLPSGVRTNTVYWAKYRSSLTGAVSNPGPGSDPQVTPVLDNTISCPYSPDPQVDKVDFYRQDSGLTIPTYVATGPNTNPPTAITDSISDTDAAANPTMNRDDLEPYPSIDLPRAGVVNVSGGVISWVSGDVFNIRWLAGTVIEIGSPTQIAYSLIARPTSTTTMEIPGVPDGTNLVYNIAEPILAAQPLAYQFGPTDNINFTFAVGDSLRPGTLYWCKGSNLDSAPDTNQQDVTDPSEPLVNGAMSGGLGALFSIKRMWIILPNFFNALATATGTSGSTWTLQATSITRGLYIPRCLAVEGGGKIFFRVEDGIHLSPGGNGSKSITDDELYPLFPHEGAVPSSIVRNGKTIYPPDDTAPNLQQFRVVAQYLYWDYSYNFGGHQGNSTLVYDIEAGGWILDATTPPALCHSSNDGQSQQGVLVGCSDFTIRSLSSSGNEAVTGTMITGAIGGEGFRHCAGFTIEYKSNATITLTPIVADSGNGSYAPAAVTLPSTSGGTAKFRSWFSPNKWKLMQFQMAFTDPTALVFIQGFEVDCRDWGSAGEYAQVSPFGEEGGFGGQK
jgi:hypothetical protein